MEVAPVSGWKHDVHIHSVWAPPRNKAVVQSTYVVGNIEEACLPLPRLLQSEDFGPNLSFRALGGILAKISL